MAPAIREYAPAIYVVRRTQLTVPEIPDFAAREVDLLEQSIAAAGLTWAGDSTFFYNGMSADPTQPFTFTIAQPVQQAGEVPPPYAIWHSPAVRVLEVDYHGSMKGIHDAWMELWETLAARGLQAADEAREVYKHWVDFDSSENVTALQIVLA